MEDYFPKPYTSKKYRSRKGQKEKKRFTKEKKSFGIHDQRTRNRVTSWLSKVSFEHSRRSIHGRLLSKTLYLQKVQIEERTKRKKKVYERKEKFWNS